jgi:hypothetical protein
MKVYRITMQYANYAGSMQREEYVVATCVISAVELVKDMKHYVVIKVEELGELHRIEASD